MGKKSGILFRRKGTRIWFAVTCFVVILALVVNILTSTYLYNLVCIVLGGSKAVYADGKAEVSYDITTEDKEDAYEKGNELVKEISEEGITLLKNEDSALQLKEGAKISVFGKNSVNLVYGGSGSGGGDNTEAKTIFDSLSEAGFEYNPTLKEFYEDDSKSGDKREDNPSDLDSGGNQMLSTAESDYSKYTQDVLDSYAEYSDAALIVLSRIGGEGFDLPRTSSDDANRHYLELDPNEQELIRQVTAAGFDQVILVINSANTMELGFVEDDTYGHIDACLTLPGPGNEGVMALGEILSGEVNPSGHTVDTWSADFTADPTWNNFGDCNITGGDQYDISEEGYFVQYEEGVYVGYRYYETRGYTDGEDWYQENVVYPFGYGLSYTTFEWTLEDSKALENTEIEANGEYSITVKVKNTGSVAGKDVIQIYGSAPYTDGEIEKPYKVLCGYVKTDLLEPGEEASYTLTFSPYDIASYDYSDANGNGFCGYELDGGAYTLFVSHNAHEDEFSIPFTVTDGGLRYETDPTTGETVENRFEDADDTIETFLSRSDWEGTWPTTPTDEDRAGSDEINDALGSTDNNNPNTYTEMPSQASSSDGEVTVQFKELSGKDYDDELWDEFMDQLTVDELAEMYNNGAFMTSAIERLGIPLTIESDGPVGYVNFMGGSNIYGVTTYTCEVMLARTWNVELAEAMGSSIGNEGYWGDDGMPYSGIYAPGGNIHRSPFGGRNFEYFSEDSYLSGMMAVYEIRGAEASGVTMYMKHFVANDQETHRSSNGVCVWLNEQSLREIYMKPFEMAVKIGGTTGMMSSFNRLGTTWAGGDYRLLTEVLRGEWGFEGTVICDFNTNYYMSTKQMIYAGGDLNLTTTRYWNKYDAADAGDVTMLRRAAKNVLYTIANTNAVTGEIVGYTMPTWRCVGQAGENQEEIHLHQ